MGTRTTLRCTTGNHHKEYQIDLVKTFRGPSGLNDRFVVNYRYGRIGGPLKEGTKTPSATQDYTANRIVRDLIDEKMDKGYVISNQEVITDPVDVPVPTPRTIESSPGFSVVVPRLVTLPEATASDRRVAEEAAAAVRAAGERANTWLINFQNARLKSPSGKKKKSTKAVIKSIVESKAKPAPINKKKKGHRNIRVVDVDSFVEDEES